MTAGVSDVPLRRLPSRFASLVKLEHTVFALPLAYAGAALSHEQTGSWPSWRELAWITLAMVGARSIAMALNRLIDRDIDARNPRTASRELPAGALSVPQVLGFVALSLALYVLALSQLDPMVRRLAPIPVVMFLVYPYLKRFTWLCHLWLGLTVGLAPLAAWVAITGTFETPAILLWLAAAAWVAGFDVFYSLFDLDFDRAHGVHSVAVRFGVAGAFWFARALHALTVSLLIAAGVTNSAGILYYVGVAAVAALLLYEHLIISPSDLRRLDAAFFTVNGVLGFVFLAFVLADQL